MRVKICIFTLLILVGSIFSISHAVTLTGILKKTPNSHLMKIQTYYTSKGYPLTKSGRFSEGDTVVVVGHFTYSGNRDRIYNSNENVFIVESINNYECCLNEELELRGDINLDGSYNIADIVMLANIINGSYYYYILCPEDLDLNGDSEFNKSDLDYLYDFLFFKGPVPVRCD